MRNLFLSLVLIISSFAYGQINVSTPAKKKIERLPYDSIQNTPKDFFQLIGQEVIVTNTKDLKYFYKSIDPLEVYEEVFDTIVSDAILKKVSEMREEERRLSENPPKKGKSKNTPIQMTADEYFSKMSSIIKRGISDSLKLTGRKFKIIDVVERVKGPKDQNNIINEYADRNKTYYYVLNDGSEQLYYKLSITYQHKSPFVCLGYYDKIKNEVLNKEFYYKKRRINKVLDYNTGEVYQLEAMDKYKCIDISVNPDRNTINMIMKNEKGNSFEAGYNNHDIYLLNESIGDHYKEMYGEMYKDAMNNTISIGMPCELVLLAWGNPEKINQSSGFDQWVYENKFIYVKDGKVIDYN